MMTRHTFANAVPLGMASVELPRFRSPLAAVFIVGTEPEVIDRVRVLANNQSILDLNSVMDRAGRRIALARLMEKKNGLREGSSFVLDLGGVQLDSFQYARMEVWLTEHARTDTCLEAVAIWAGSAT